MAAPCVRGHAHVGEDRAARLGALRAGAFPDRRLRARAGHLRLMAKRKQRREAPAEKPAVDYTDADGNVLTLRESLSAGTVAKLAEPAGGAAASADDLWR